MPTPQRRRKAFRDAWLYAFTTRFPGSNEELFTVRVSTELDSDDEWMSPVDEFLAKHCTSEIGSELVEDPAYFAGEYQQTEHHVYQQCPGESVHHNCCFAEVSSPNRGERWSITGQSAR